jgi:Tol biopolymer transport system component
MGRVTLSLMVDLVRPVARAAPLLALACCLSGATQVASAQAPSQGCPLTTHVGAPILGDFDPRWSPDGRSIAVTHIAPGGVASVKVVDLHTHHRVSLGAGRGPAWSPAGDFLALSRPARVVTLPSGVCLVEADIVRVSRSGGQETNLTATETGHETAPEWSPDGTRVGYLDFLSARQIGALEVDSRTRTGWSLPNGYSVPNYGLGGPGPRRGLAWSPGTTRIAVTGERHTGGMCPCYDFSAVWIINTASSTVQPLHDVTAFNERDPAWSSDGDRLAFTRLQVGYFYGGSRIWVSNADGSAARQLTSSVQRHPDSHPAWSPDGRLIAFARRIDPRTAYGMSVYTIHPDGTHLRFVARGDYPVWSPDGRALAFVRTPPSGGDFSPKEKSQVWTVDLSRSRLVPRVL